MHLFRLGVSNYRSATLPPMVITGGTMSTLTRQTISLQASAEVIAAIQKIADQQGRPFQAVLEDALRAYVELQDDTRPRAHVLEAFEESLQTYDVLYRELAK